MPKKKIVKRDGLIVNTSLEARALIKKYYTEKFFNKFLSKFEFEGLDYQQQAYIMRQFWGKGTVAGFIIPKTEELGFTPWTTGGIYNIYDYPTAVLLINTRGVSFIPDSALPLDEEGGACIGYIQKDRKPVYEIIEPMLNKLVDIEMTIRTNLKAQKTPWMFGVSPENDFKMNNLWNNIDSDDPKLFVSIEDLANAKALVSGATYNIDKLEQLRQQTENEILSRLSIDNIGVMEKKEHLTVGEVDSNKELITSSGDEFIDCMNEWFTNIKTYLNYSKPLSVKLKQTSMPKESEEEEEDYEE